MEDQPTTTAMHVGCVEHLSKATSPAAAPKLSGKGMSQSVHEMITACGASPVLSLLEVVLPVLVFTSFRCCCSGPLPCGTSVKLKGARLTVWCCSDCRRRAAGKIVPQRGL